MKKISLFLSMVMALVTVSCASAGKEAKEEKVEAQTQMAQKIVPIEGFWRLVDYVGIDGAVNEVPADETYILSFDPKEHHFGLTTDCNFLGGEYKTEGDSIKFDNIASTLMLCHDEKIERAMKAILLRIDTYAINPDTILRLRSDMRIMATFVRTTEEVANATINQ